MGARDVKLYNVTKKTLISEEVLVAPTFFKKVQGLLGLETLEKEKSLWIHGCPSVHTFFMKFAIDVVFVDKNMKVTSVVSNLKPWRMTVPFQYKNDSCFEFLSGNVGDKIKEGDILDVRS